MLKKWCGGCGSAREACTRSHGLLESQPLAPFCFLSSRSVCASSFAVCMSEISTKIQTLRWLEPVGIGFC